MLLRGRAMGQNVVCEYPTYDRALESIFQARANLLYLDLHPGGFADDQLEYIVSDEPEAGACLYQPDLSQSDRRVALEGQARDARRLAAQ